MVGTEEASSDALSYAPMRAVALTAHHREASGRAQRAIGICRAERDTVVGEPLDRGACTTGCPWIGRYGAASWSAMTSRMFNGGRTAYHTLPRMFLLTDLCFF